MIRRAFNRASAKREGSGSLDFLEAILRERPDLRGMTAYFPGEYDERDNEGELVAEGHEQGGNGHTVFIGDEVFKGPRCVYLHSDEEEPFFDKEHKILRQMEGKGLLVPRVTCVGKETIFYGMTRLPGVALSRLFMQEFSPKQKQWLAKDIAGFIVGMALALPRDAKGGFAVHGDLQPKNILIDPETRRLSGVVDFGIINYTSNLPYVSGGESFNRILHADERLRKTFGCRSTERALLAP